METACLPSGTSAHAPETAFCDRTNGVSTEKRVGRAGDGGTERAARDAAFSPARLKQGGCRVHAGGNRAEPDAIVARNAATKPGCLASHHALVDQRTAESSSTVSEFGCNGSEPKSCHTDSEARLLQRRCTAGLCETVLRCPGVMPVCGPAPPERIAARQRLRRSAGMGNGHWIQRVCVVGVAVLLCAAGASAQEQPRLNLMPWPANLQTGSGSLRIDSSFSVALTGHTEARLDRAAQRFLRQLSRQTAIPLSARASAKPTLSVHTDHASKEVQELGEDESYALSITADGAQIDASTPLGPLPGLQTFLQLVEVSPNGFAAPAVTIQDKPRFPWRGLMIDVARHFIPLDVLKRNLDGMEAVKMNVFHWHLSEDQGFRAESKKFPKLHTVVPTGLNYTQNEFPNLTPSP